jgi:hypothetical protein
MIGVSFILVQWTLNTQVSQVKTVSPLLSMQINRSRNKKHEDEIEKTDSNQNPRFNPMKSRYQRTNRTMAACLFIMDDTLRLMEWLAYHYTVLPLGDLIVAIDPHSHRKDRILEILQMWKPYIRIQSYSNDEWLTLESEEGWGRQVYAPRGGYRHWFTDTEGDVYRAQAHKRRQNFFFSYCLQSHFNNGIRSWTILIDSDEFLIFNYRHPLKENETVYDAVTKLITPNDLDKARKRIVPIREKLPNWEEEITIADFLYNYTSSLPSSVSEEENLLSSKGLPPKKLSRAEAAMEHTFETAGIIPQRPKCLRFPHLRFSSYESNPKLVSADIPDHVDPTTLMTLRHRKVGPIDSLFSKAMLDLSQAKSAEWFNFKGVVNVHTPSRRMCGRTTKIKFSGSGTDYISSLFRIHHYRSGTIETYLERSNDYRGSSIWRFYAERNLIPVHENDDIRGWIRCFLRKVGEARARKLLLQPMEDAYHAYQHHERYASAKEVLDRLQGDDPLEHQHEKKEVVKYNYTKTNEKIAACIFVRDGNIKLIEWIAYHYTVLPLGSLIVGVSSESKQTSALRETVHRWSSLIDIKIWTHDEWLKGANQWEGWKRNPREDGDKVSSWFADKSSQEYLYQEAVRREHLFIGNCLVHHHKNQCRWTAVLHPSDFVVFNYKGPQENPVKFDSREIGVRTKDDIIHMRTETSPIRRRLPPLTDRVTIADFLKQENISTCIRMPGLEMGPREFSNENHLLTLRQREYGVKKGTWVKVMVDVKSPHTWRKVNSIHNLPICGSNGRLEATDYISSLLRFHHFRLGSLESFAEKYPMDANIIHMYKNASDDFEPYGDDHGSLNPWLDWFVTKVGKRKADELLFSPLNHAYKIIREGNPALRQAREDMESNGGGDD